MGEPTKKAVLDALIAEMREEQMLGKPDEPQKPLVGSENVEVTEREEQECK